MSEIEINKDISFKLVHDQQAVEVMLGNDQAELSLEDLGNAISSLTNMKVELLARKIPPAPAPMKMSDVGHGGKEDFAYCGNTKVSDPEFEPWFTIAGHDLKLENVKKLYDWLGRAIKYAEDVDGDLKRDNDNSSVDRS